jgi:transposase
MEQHTFFSATLGLHHPWKISTILFSKEEKRLDITVDFAPDEPCTCPTCGKTVEMCTTTEETWHHNDFFRYATYLHARVPQMNCACCGISMVERPWSRDGSRFILI